MLKSFFCPDGQQCSVDQCLSDGGCRMVSRCAPRAFLVLAAAERKWDGRPSVTQLIKGTREAYLSIVSDYSVDPADAAYRVIGTRSHAALDKDVSETLTEEKLELAGIVGTFDAIEVENGKTVLIDNKTSGSYKVAKALGIRREAKDVECVDETGAVVLLKSGPNKGKPKTIKQYSVTVGAPDMLDWELQVNMYRLMAEHAGLTIDKMVIFAIPRDGGTYVAEGNGIDKKMYMIEVLRMDDAEIMAYFSAKRDALVAAMETKTIPAECSADECWDGRKCGKYCAVADACRAAGCRWLGVDDEN